MLSALLLGSTSVAAMLLLAEWQQPTLRVAALLFVMLAAVIGGGFYLAGTVGLLRFPDALSRLHALTKADNVGLLFVCVGLGLLSGHLQTAALLGLSWLLALA